MKPITGIVPLWDDEKESYWMLPGYMKGIEAAGGLPIMLPMTADEEDLRRICDVCSGFLFTGGHDVAPELYGEERIAACGISCGMRDEMEMKLLKIAFQKDMPVLGICRGIQFLNAALGGDLYQDLPSQRPSDLEHHQKPPYDRNSHNVNIPVGTPLHKLLGKEFLAVNSYHHQGIRRLSDKLKVMAKAEDGLVEAVWMPEHTFVWAVQWHPEFSYAVDEDSRKILEGFVAAMNIFKDA